MLVLAEGPLPFFSIERICPTPCRPTSNEELILAFLADSGDDYTSGEALSDKLGLSRTAVWKYVESLRKRGYRIEAVSARGYRLVEVPDRISGLELSPLLNTRDLGRVVHYFEALPSTQSEQALGAAAVAGAVATERWSSPSSRPLGVAGVAGPGPRRHS